MVIFNRIINVLVLLAAIAAVVFGILLFQKRDQITLGRQMMAKAVTSAVKTIDPAVPIKESDMDISKPADGLKKPLNELKTVVDVIVNQRNDMADLLSVLHEIVLAPPDDKRRESKVIAAYGSTKDQQKEIREEVQSTMDNWRDREEKLIQRLKDFADVYGRDFDAEDVATNDQMSDFFSNLIDRSKFILAKSGDLGKHIGEVADIMSHDKPEVAGDDYKPPLNTHIEAIKTYVDEFAKTKTKVNELEATLKKREEMMKKVEDQIKILVPQLQQTQKDLAAANKEITRLKRIIDPTEGEDGEAGSASKNIDINMLKNLYGKVVYVDEANGFVTINLGRRNKITRQISDTETRDLFVPLPPDAVMTIATSLDSEQNPRYVGKIQISNISSMNSIGNLLPTPKPPQDLKLEVGQVVFFSESDLKRMDNIRKAKIKQEEKEAADRAALEAAAVREITGDRNIKPLRDEEDPFAAGDDKADDKKADDAKEADDEASSEEEE